jgi:hypothetical protein
MNLIICYETYDTEGKRQMFSMLHASVNVIKAKIYYVFFVPFSMYVQLRSKRKKRMLDLSKPIISNSHTLIALLRWKALGLGSHILKLNLLLSQKKHLVLPCSSSSTSTTTSSNRLKTQDSDTHFNVSSNFN